MTGEIKSIKELAKYCNSLTRYSRRKTREIYIGDIPLGGGNPIRLQSMTVVDTMDTRGSVEQALRMVEAGCEYVRITAPSIRDAENLRNIKKELHNRGCDVPLIADIHFTPNAAELAARIVEKVRVNPGNYADKKKFQQIEYTDDSYNAEIERIRMKFTPLVEICKEYGTAMRIGTNHGSLSDRIMSRYGDTPLGMVESALEFVRICEDLNYYDVVLSMKASNPQVMVQAYRLLVQKLNEEELQPYPLHLGVTEAGEGEDGRIKSAVGIGTLLEDGLGDTVRVSLTEEPEEEIPVARSLVERYVNRPGHDPIIEASELEWDPFHYNRRDSREVGNIGGSQVPRVIADFTRVKNPEIHDIKAIGHFYLPELDKWSMNDMGADYIYTGNNPVQFMLPNGLKEIQDYTVWKNSKDKRNKFPLYHVSEFMEVKEYHQELNFIELTIGEADQLQKIKDRKDIVILLDTDNEHAMPEQRRFMFLLSELQWDVPVIFKRKFDTLDPDELRLYAATDFGGLLIDGYGDGIMLSTERSPINNGSLPEVLKMYNSTAFGILQASRTRISKTEYISCPSCGRTLFDLQETTAMIRKRTDHLKGVKIGIMGCIVNGPGEMADADYGYVGSGKGKITLYRGKEVVKRNVPSLHAVDELIELIREDGNWREPKSRNEIEEVEINE